MEVTERTIYDRVDIEKMVVRKYLSKDIKIAVIGLGHIGLPLAVSLANAGYDVTGIDTNHAIAIELNEGRIRSTKTETGLEEALSKALENKKFEALIPDLVEEDWFDVYFVTIGVNIDENFHPDLTSLKSVLQQIKFNPTYTLIIIRPTVPVGTFNRIVLPTLEIEAQKQGIRKYEYSAVYVPERLAEGKALEEIKTLPEVVGTTRELSFALTNILFKSIGTEEKKVRRCLPEEAEYVKLFCNTFRYVNFALANQFALLTKNGIDPYRVIDLCNSDYHRAQIPRPGLVGGYCLSKDGFLLTQDPQGNFIADAWRLNEFLPSYIVDKVMNYNKNVHQNKAQVVVLGRTFKKDSDDMRLSPADKVYKIFKNYGIDVKWIDPYLHNDDNTASMEEIEYHSANDSYILVVAMNHTIFSKVEFYKKIGFNITIFDCWNVVPIATHALGPVVLLFGRDF
jgi:UDP-N-acetyl-D-mannosaminuronic acid dehydrogenase